MTPRKINSAGQAKNGDGSNVGVQAVAERCDIAVTNLGERLLSGRQS
jgi:hypothetical protein